MIYIGFAYGGHGVCYCMFVKAFQTRVVNSYFCIVIGQRYNLILHETRDKRNVNRARYIESYLLSLFDIYTKYMYRYMYIVITKQLSYI